MLQEGLVSVAYVDCSSNDISCKKQGIQSGTVFLPAGNSTQLLQDGLEIHTLNYLEIATQVFEQLPDVQLIDEAGVQLVLHKLRDDIGPDWLILFSEGATDYSSFLTLQYRRLPVLLPKFKLARVDCQVSDALCR